MVHEPEPGDVIGGRYVLRERLGEGGMGQVFRAEQVSLGRDVAIKLLHPELRANAQVAQHFRAEALAACRVNHPGAVGIIDCELGGPLPYIVMHYVAGRPLGELIAEDALSLSRAVHIVDQILDVLEAVHAAGVVHGDLKSDNVLITAPADDARADARDGVTLIDFGLAYLGQATGDTGLLSGTPEYMAPELARGEAPTPASDLYAVGVILYELLAGKTPFEGGTAADILARHVEDPVVPPSLRGPARSLPAALDDVVLRALAKEPCRRFSDAAEMRAALARAMARPHASDACPRCGQPIAAFEVCTHCTTQPMPRRSVPRTESPTRPHTIPRVRVARGSAAAPPHASQRPADRLRDAIGAALVRGDVAAIARLYVALAVVLAGEHRLGDAIRELEEGVDVLAAAGRSDQHLVRTLERVRHLNSKRAERISLS